MLHPTRSGKSRDQSSRGNSPGEPILPISTRNLTELSEVPCYTCRRRHVKCDRNLPACAKCAKKGVPCLGYQKPLRWAEGVAVRGKLKGKAQPIVESHMQPDPFSPLQDVEYCGPQSAESVQTVGSLSEAAIRQLITYHNTVICAEAASVSPETFIDRSIAPLSPGDVDRIPRDLLNCILAISAVHMAMRHPEIRDYYKLALGTKAEVYGRLHQMLKDPPRDRPELVYCYTILIFAMDIIENGMSRWRIHLNGIKEVIAWLGGTDAMVHRYPYLQPCLFFNAHFETMHIASSYVPLTTKKYTERRAIETLVNAPHLKSKAFNPSPPQLTVAFWDIGTTAASLLGHQIGDTAGAIARREQILFDVLHFKTADWVEELRYYYPQLIQDQKDAERWEFIGAAWKNAAIILALRYLFFGRADTSSDAPPEATVEPFPIYSPYASPLSFGVGFESPFESMARTGTERSRLSPSAPYPRRTGSSSSTRSSDLYANRYRIHNEAFTALSLSLTALSQLDESTYLRHILVPVLIFACVTSPGSVEREMCKNLIVKFKDAFFTGPLPTFADASMSSQSRESSPMPPVSSGLELEISWYDLDNFSAMMENNIPLNSGSREGLTYGAVEWNWWDMLYNLKLDLDWPITAGTAVLEANTDLWAYTIMSSVITQDSFTSWAQT